MSRYHTAYRMLSVWRPGSGGELTTIETPLDEAAEKESLDRYGDPFYLTSMQVKLQDIVMDVTEQLYPAIHRDAVTDIILIKMGLVFDRATIKNKWIEKPMQPFTAVPIDNSRWGEIGRPLSGQSPEGYEIDWIQRALVHKQAGKPPSNMASVRRSPDDWRIVNVTHKKGDRPKSTHLIEWSQYGPADRGKDIDTALRMYASNPASFKSMFTPIRKGADELLVRAMGYVPSVVVSKFTLSTTWSTVQPIISQAMRTIGNIILEEQNEDVKKYLQFMGQGLIQNKTEKPPIESPFELPSN